MHKLEREPPLQLRGPDGSRGPLSKVDSAKGQTRRIPSAGVRGVVDNNTGLPNQLKAGLEKLSGLNLSGIRVHTNSSRPAQLNALAYTQGQNIHLAPGQEKHLPHEGWHVVQQMQGRVRPTSKIGHESINDEEHLEREGDVMGARALQLQGIEPVKPGSERFGLKPPHRSAFHGDTIQRFEAPVHESIELGALTGGSGALSPEEASAVYFGNWMRDVNQVFVPTVTSTLGLPPEAVFTIVNYLAVRHFGRGLTPEQFGYYLPPEHIDNPGGLAPARPTRPTSGASHYSSDLLTAQPAITSGTGNNRPGEVPRPAPFVTRQESVLPRDMQGGRAGQVLGQNIFAVDQTGMMAFIRRTNQHVERRLEWSALRGRNSDGLLHFGAALHSVEDYFTHSNFVEIAVNRALQANSALLPNLHGAQRSTHTFSPEVAVPTGTRGVTEQRSVLTTGTFTGTDTQISIAAELVNMLSERPGPPRSPAETRAEQQMMIQVLGALSTQLQGNAAFRSSVVEAIIEQVPAWIPRRVRGMSLQEAIDGWLQSVPLDEVYRLTRVPIYLRPVLNAIGVTALEQALKIAFYDNLMMPAARQIQAVANEARATETSLLAQRDTHRRIATGQFTSAELAQQQALAEADGGTATQQRRHIQNQQAAARGEAVERRDILNATPEAVVAGPSHSQITRDHADSPFFGIAFTLAHRAVQWLRSRMIAAWGEIHGTTASTTPYTAAPGPNATQRERDLFTVMGAGSERARRRGHAIVRRGGAMPGTAYDIDAQRNRSADNVESIAQALLAIANGTGSISIFLRRLSLDLGRVNAEELSLLEQRILNAVRQGVTSGASGASDFNAVVAPGLRATSAQLSQDATSIRAATTLDTREAANNALVAHRNEAMVLLAQAPNVSSAERATLLVYLNRETQSTAVSYTTRQRDAVTRSASSLGQPVNMQLGNPVNRPVEMTRPPLNLSPRRGPQLVNLLMTSRRILSHPQEDSWWQRHVNTYISAHGREIAQSIRARNEGYLVFRQTPAQRRANLRTGTAEESH